jgi:8-oxo-dGTP pyrophosphatase MutT (NUDIX family)
MITSSPMEKSIDPKERPRPASTVILVRQGDQELEVYLLERSSKSGFMPGNYVFPGGTVEPEDRGLESWEKHVDLKFSEVSRRLGGGLVTEEALAHGVAAVRETFEEAGLLLEAGGTPESSDLEDARGRMASDGAPARCFRDWVVSRRKVLALSKLRRWTHWITPRFRKQRYDTRFFVAFVTAAQKCTPDDRETVRGIWISPRRALEKNALGEVPLSPPTLVTLHELSSYEDRTHLEAATENRPWGPARLPRVVSSPEGEGPLILLPWDPMYHEEAEGHEPRRLKGKTPSPGELFSRLYHEKGIWRPLASS